MVHSILEASSTASSNTACLSFENDLALNWKQTLKQIHVFASHDILKYPTQSIPSCFSQKDLSSIHGNIIDPVIEANKFN